MNTMTIGNGVRHREVSLAEYQNLIDGKDSRLVRWNPEASTSFITDTDLYREAWSVQNSIVDRYIPADTLAVEVAVDPRQDSYRAVPMLSVDGNCIRSQRHRLGNYVRRAVWVLPRT